MTTPAVIREIGDGLGRVGAVPGAAGIAAPEWRLVQSIRNAIHKTIESFRNWRHRQQTVETLSMLSDHHLRDIGIVRGDIPRIARAMSQSRNLS